MIVEVLSPSSADRDRKAKRTIYSRFGVREYWIVDPEKETLEQLIYKDTGLQKTAVIPRDGRIDSKVVEGFTLDLAPVFAAIP